VEQVMESDSLAQAMEALTVAPTEAQPEAMTQVETQQPVAQPQAAPEPPPPQPSRTVPLPELMEERHKRQLAEREREAARRELELVQRFMEGQRQQQPQPQVHIPDPATDPEGYTSFMLAKMQEQSIHQRANQSEMFARREHGDEKVEAAIQAAVQAGINRNFMMQPDPYGALMRWHAANQVVSEVGTDLQAYRQKIEAEVRQRLLAEQQVAGKPAPQNLPPSLSTATRASVASPGVMDTGDFFKTMFGKSRTG
jgi:hypothetical protein